MGSAVLTTAVATMVKQEHPSTNYNSSTKLAIRDWTNSDVNTYLWWSRPFPLGATILSAEIVFYTAAEAGTGTRGITLTRLNSTFSASKTTYANRVTNFIAGDLTQTKTRPWADKTEWRFNVASWMQTVANGGFWGGVRVIPNTHEDEVIWLYSELWSDSSLRPRLEVTWSDAPQAPSGLSPSGGRAVGLSKPYLKATFRDLSGSTTLAALQVQINATDVWTAPTFDSGTVATSVPELNLATTAYAGLADGATTFWRIRFQDGAGVWSAWSTATSFKRDDKGTLTINNPPVGNPIVEDSTPPLAWTFTGETQSAYQVQIKHKLNGVEVVDWDTGKITSTATSITVPGGKINESTGTVYTLTIRIWDAKSREATANDTPYVEGIRDFTFVPGATAGTLALTATPDPIRPTVNLRWASTTFPDRYNILRNGKVIAAAIDPVDTFMTGQSFVYTDVSVSGGEFGALPGVYDTDYHYDGQASLNSLAQKGIRRVRIPIKMERLQPTAGAAFNATEQTRITDLVARVAAAGMTCKIEAHNFARRNVAGTDYTLGHANYTQAHHVDFFSRLAALFAGSPTVMALGYNEPHDIPDITGTFTPAITHYSWDSTTQGWTGETLAVSATQVHDGANSLSVTHTFTAGGFQLARIGDNNGTTHDESANGLTYAVWVWCPAGETGWSARIDIQDASFANIAGSTTSLTANSWNLVTGTFTLAQVSAMKSKNIQIQNNSPTAGAKTFYVDTFRQGTMVGAQTGLQQWQAADAAAYAAVVAAGFVGPGKEYHASGYDWSAARTFATINGAPWITKNPALPIRYEAHSYGDDDRSGVYVNSYATETSNASAQGYASVGLRWADWIDDFAAWCTANSVQGVVGEIGWPDDANWNVAARLALNAAAGLDITYWSVGEWWGTTYPLSPWEWNGSAYVANSQVPVLTSDIFHTWTDNSPSPTRTLTYQVQRVVNDVASAGNAAAVTKIPQKSAVWLREPTSGLEIALFPSDAPDWDLGAIESVSQSIAPESNKVAINQSLGGLEGQISGTLTDAYGLTAQQWRDNLLKMRALRVKKFYLTVGDITIQVVAQGFKYRQANTKEITFDASFMAYQQDRVSNIYLGA